MSYVKDTESVETQNRIGKMNTYIFTTGRGMEVEIRAWFREQAIKDFVFMWQPETFVKIEKL
jgi:hypothetical protein